MTRCLNLGDTPALVSASSSSKFGVTAIEGSRRVISDSYSAGLNASWEADLFGRNRGNLAAAGESLNAVHAALAGEITTAYTSHRGDQARASVPALRESIARTGNLLARLSGREPGSLDALLSSTGRGIPDPPSASRPIPTPFSPPSGPSQLPFHEPSAESKFLAVDSPGGAP